MTAPPIHSVFAWGLGALLVSGAAPGSAAPGPASTVQKPAARPPAAVLAAPVAAATTPAGAAAPAPAMGVSEARGALERGMTELGELALRARQSGDMVRIACVQDKQDRAEAVMEVATGDLLAAQDPQADAQTRAFAGEKLAEGAQQLKGLVQQARACQGKEEATNAGGSNDVRVPQGVLPQDPTAPLPPSSRGLPPIDPRLPPASPVL